MEPASAAKSPARAATREKGPTLSTAAKKRPNPGPASAGRPPADHSVVSPRPFRGPPATTASAPILPIPRSPGAPPPGSRTGPAGRLGRYRSRGHPRTAGAAASTPLSAPEPAASGVERRGPGRPRVPGTSPTGPRRPGDRAPAPSAASWTPGWPGPTPPSRATCHPRDWLPGKGRWPPADRFLPKPPRVGTGPLQRARITGDIQSYRNCSTHPKTF